MSENQEKKKEFSVPGRNYSLDLDKLHREELELREAKKVAQPKQNPNLLNAMSMISVGVDFAVMIAAPLIIFTFIGNRLDAKYGTKYWVIVGIILAIFTTVVGIRRQIIKLRSKVK